MSKLIEEEKIAIEKAFVDIESGRYMYSCLVLDRHYKCTCLARKYSKFFNQRQYSILDFCDMHAEERKQARLMLLATFYVLAGEL